MSVNLLFHSIYQEALVSLSFKSDTHEPTRQGLESKHAKGLGKSEKYKVPRTLSEDVEYFYIHDEEQLTIGDFTSPKHPMFPKESFQLFSEHFSILSHTSSPEGWLSGELIDCFMKLKSQSWPESTFVSTEISYLILNLG
ncbi:hypothetical protein TKK_0019496 [Trichogramma kaykai]